MVYSVPLPIVWSHLTVREAEVCRLRCVQKEEEIGSKHKAVSATQCPLHNARSPPYQPDLELCWRCSHRQLGVRFVGIM